MCLACLLCFPLELSRLTSQKELLETSRGAARTNLEAQIQELPLDDSTRAIIYAPPDQISLGYVYYLSRYLFLSDKAAIVTAEDLAALPLDEYDYFLCAMPDEAVAEYERLHFHSDDPMHAVALNGTD